MSAADELGQVSKKMRAPFDVSTYQLSYGIVQVIAGRHAGEVGYYDDDERGAIVYLGYPFRSRVIRVPVRHLRPATKAQANSWRREAIAQRDAEAAIDTARRLAAKDGPN